MNSPKVAQYISDWMAGYLKKSGMSGYVIGISGGIDSAVVSSLAAMCGSRTLCALLPIHQAPAQVSRAIEHAQALRRRYPNVEIADIDLTSAYDTFVSSFGTLFSAGQNQTDLANANARSRLRMTALYHCAGMNNLLVAGTGNKIEDFGVGFYTKYGDGGVDISPIADLVKTEVYELGRWLGVPESILSAAPTDGLFGDDRTDEQQIGASYPELEKAMTQAAAGQDPASMSERERQVYEIYLHRNRANRHKMEPIPVCMVPEEIKNS